MTRPGVTLPKSFGPRMRALTEKQRAFVLALLEIPIGKNGKGNHTEAARMAGYSGESVQSLRVQAYRLAHDENIQAAIKEVALGTMSSEAINLVGVLLQIAYGELPATASEKMKAIAMVFNRTGIPETTQHFVKVEHNINNDDALERLYRFSKILGIDPKTVLGTMGLEVVEGEFRETGDDVLKTGGDVPLLTDDRVDTGEPGDSTDDPFSVD